MPGGSFNKPDERSRIRRIYDHETGEVETIDYDSNMRKIKAHGDSKCPLCGHSGWCHAGKRCSAFRADIPQVPSKIFPGTMCSEIPPGDSIEDWYCGCTGELCKTNKGIIDEVKL
jgi:hypothetical protein